jgi:dihydroorotate dehydrogenase (NAD+) catalytic subunit
MVDLSTRIGSLSLDNVIMPASGTFSDELAQVIDFDRLGAYVTKTITREFRSGNPTPRVAETGGGMLNSIGIPSKGIRDLLDRIVPAYRGFRAPLVVSVSANTPAEFATLCRDVSVPGVSAIEVNISCPNLEADGHAFAMRPDLTHEVIAEIRKATRLPIWAKLTPNTGEIANVAQAAESGGADAVVVANTILGMSIDLQTFRPSLGSGMGGFSGPAVRPILLRMAYQCAQAVSIPVIGCGGISTARDALEYIVAGCSAVQVGTATFIHPTAMITVLDELESFCSLRGISRLMDIKGAVGDIEESGDLSGGSGGAGAQRRAEVV